MKTEEWHKKKLAENWTMSVEALASLLGTDINAGFSESAALERLKLRGPK